MRLARARLADVDRLHGLFSIPAVYRYLADGVPPRREVAQAWIAASTSEPGPRLGVWLLTGAARAELLGCVRLTARSDAGPRTAELTYLLDPAVWGRGLAARMSWTVVSRAFEAGDLDAVIAGADAPNLASIAVMRRLGMTFLREVAYPAGPGLEYVLRRGDAWPNPQPEPIALDPE